MKETNFSGLLETIKKLEQENYRLSCDNSELAERLNSKRYKATDFLVDGLYSTVKKKDKNKKTEIIERNIEKPEKKEELSSVKFKKRKIVKGLVDIININFYDWKGKTIFKGGAERYVYDLACLLRGMGYTPRILQCSDVPFKKEFKGIEVIGLGGGSVSNMYESSYMFSYFCRSCEFIIASPLELACKIKDVPVIGINHGINFDGDWNKYNPDCPRYYNEYMDALNNVVSCVCVDTNFINWTRTQDYKAASKERYIPNYYDATQFMASAKKQSGKRVRFVYPRRIYSARGYDITIEAFRKLYPKYEDKIILEFVGQIDNRKAKKDLEKLMADFPESVFRTECNMDDMAEIYQRADVVLVPTRYCEGTSLSCIEGMASGAAVIVTDVGGLPNLVIDRFNGLIVSPTSDDLAEAMIKMIDDQKMRKELAENGEKVAKMAFGRELWEERWEEEIRKVAEDSLS